MSSWPLDSKIFIQPLIQEEKTRYMHTGKHLSFFCSCMVSLTATGKNQSCYKYLKKKINSSWVYVHWAQQEKGPSDSILSAIQRSTGAQMNKWRYSYICLEIFQVKKIKILKLFSPKLVVVRWLQHSCQLQNKKPSQLQLLLTVKYFPRDK